LFVLRLREKYLQAAFITTNVVMPTVRPIKPINIPRKRRRRGVKHFLLKEKEINIMLIDSNILYRTFCVAVD